MDAPKQILLATDDWHLEDFLELPDGRYLWVTGQGDRNRSFACSYWFNSSGEIVEHDIEEIKDQASRREVFDKHLKRLDGGESAELYVNLFTVSKFGYEFGLFPISPEEFRHPDATWRVELMPGNSMSWYPPWDVGEYDT